MRTVGIIAEYNPFHNGHAYQLEAAKRQARADYAVAVMSGDFVQRGAPAIYGKHLRAEMALRAGADLVVEMPVFGSVSGAADFARCGISLLQHMHVIDALSFGSESGDLNLLRAWARRLDAETPEISAQIRAHLKKGFSWPKAVAAAHAPYIPSAAAAANGHPADRPQPSGAADEQPACLLQPFNTANEQHPSARLQSSDAAAAAVIPPCDPLPAAPNDILGIEYLRALEKIGSPIEPLPLKRRGAAYHSGEITGEFASATAIRRRLLAENAGRAESFFSADRTSAAERMNPVAAASASGTAPAPGTSPPPGAAPPPGTGSAEKGPASDLSGVLPAAFFSTLSSILGKAVFSLPTGLEIAPDDFSMLFNARLLSADLGEIRKAAQMPEDLADKLYRRRLDFSPLTDRIAACKDRQYTYARVSRALLSLALGITKGEAARFKAQDSAPWIRILGFRKSASPLIAALTARADRPVLTKTAAAKTKLPAAALPLFEKHLQTCELYRLAAEAKTGRTAKNEYTRPLIYL